MAVINFRNEVVADGPSGFWRLGEPLGSLKAFDETSNHNDGTCSPSGITFGQPGFHGGDTAALFDGRTGRIIVHNSDSLNPSHLTMEAKVRWDGPNDLQQRILEKSSYPEVAQYSLQILPDGSVQVELRVLPKPTDPPDKVITLTLKSATPVALGTETHIVATYNGEAIKIYLNGGLDNETTYPRNSISPKPPTADNLIESGVGIGNQTQRDRPFNGLIDEVALYPAALSAERVMAHYQAQFVRVIFQYAVKFVCGTSKGQVVAPGQYFTAINVHNPTYAPVHLRAKLAVALPGLKPGPVSGFVNSILGPDEALEIDCPDIFNPKIFPHAPAKAEFLKGFVVIESEVELDVVAVYTAAGSERQVESIHTERVPARSRKAGASEASVDFEPPRG